MKFAIFFLAEFTNLFVVSSIATVMFLGGGDNPIPPWILQKIPMHTSDGGSASVIRSCVKDLHLINPETLFATLWVIAQSLQSGFLRYFDSWYFASFPYRPA
jgi:NADH:ubiquinone oxidoreductase subunit H